MIEIFLIAYLALGFVFVKNALHMFQQNRYELYRYTKWLFNKRNLHFSFIFIYFVLTFVAGYLVRGKVFSRRIYLFFVFCLTIAFAIFYLYHENKKEYVKDLVYTARVKRQIVVISIVYILICYLALRNISLFYVGLISVYGPYLLIYVLYIISEPFERLIKKSYENKARTILRENPSLIKIGITGSFGKTSTKNIVGDVIGNHFYTLITPASYNTPMGLTKTIRELLKPIHEVFVAEMGADHVGEISYLMDFIRPRYGIVTSIGPQHLNTFKSMDNIVHEKMEMIERLPFDGVGIINADNAYIDEYRVKNSCKVIRCGIKNENADYVAYDLKFSNEGTSFKVDLNGKAYKFKTCLLGEHNVMNILLGIALAVELGMEPKELKEAVKNVKQVEHRLELKKINGLTFIDNAFNSNPVSSKLSLDVLSKMKGQRVIVTPGLIDLGKLEEEYNFEFGRYMKDKADVVILVGKKNTESINKGLLAVDFNRDNIICVDSVKEAFMYCYTNFTSEDTILLENDLPDAFLYV